MALIAIFLGLVFCYGLVSRCLERGVVTAPIVFTTAGMLTLLPLPWLSNWRGNLAVFLPIAELGLVLLLFADASRTDLQVLKSIRNLPVRLLSTGMLLTILLGALAALVIFPKLSLWEAGILSAVLAPTDAGLGQIIVNSPRVPMKIRQALNVEAGLNDGLSVPFLLFFMALAGVGKDIDNASLPRFLLEQLGYGTLIGVVIGLTGGFLLGLAARRQSISVSFEQLGLVTLPLLCVIASKASHASMFIAAFVAGLAVQVGFKQASEHSIEFTEEWGQLLNLSVFFLFGILVAQSFHDFSLTHVLYGISSLTIIRMLPVAIALIGTRISWATVSFVGWFGPRGLASIVLGLVFLEHGTHSPGEPTIRLAVMATVLLSIFAHGLSAIPGINLYATTLASTDAFALEGAAVGASPGASRDQTQRAPAIKI